MKIVVLIKQVPDTWGERRLDSASGRVDRASSDRIVDEIGERALEAALAVKDSDRDTEVVALTMGPAPASDALRKALSMGADSAVHVLDDSLAGADLLRTGVVLAAALTQTGFDLVITGNESTDGRGGVIPALVAERLGIAALVNLDALQVAANRVTGTRGTEDGTAEVSSALPALVAITERMPEARFPNLKGILGAKKKPVTVLTVAELGVDLAALPASAVLSTVERPARSAGRIVVDDGATAGELVAYLADNRLI